MTARPRAAPRNYFGLEQGHVDRSAEPVYHDELTGSDLTGCVELTIEALAPVHVGCGAFELRGEQIYKEPARREDRLVIPGSSIKGVCRQVFEAITASGSPFDSAEHHHARRGGLVSVAATVFGTLGLQGRVSFDDAVPAAADGQSVEVEAESIRLSVAYQPRKPVGRRFYGPLPTGADQPARLPALAIPAGTVLRTTLRFRNLTHPALGGVLLSLGIGRFTPRLGGGKYDDFGWVRFQASGYRLRPPGLSGGGRLERDSTAVAAFVADCQGRLTLDNGGRAALEVLTRKLQAPGAGSSGGGRK